MVKVKLWYHLLIVTIPLILLRRGLSFSYWPLETGLIMFLLITGGEISAARKNWIRWPLHHRVIRGGNTPSWSDNSGDEVFTLVAGDTESVAEVVKTGGHRVITSVSLLLLVLDGVPGKIGVRSGNIRKLHCTLLLLVFFYTGCYGPKRYMKLMFRFPPYYNCMISYKKSKYIFCVCYDLLL